VRDKASGRLIQGKVTNMGLTLLLWLLRFVACVAGLSFLAGGLALPNRIATRKVRIIPSLIFLAVTGTAFCLAAFLGMAVDDKILEIEKKEREKLNVIEKIEREKPVQPSEYGKVSGIVKSRLTDQAPTLPREGMAAWTNLNSGMESNEIQTSLNV
jgi:hypothetical protein